MLQTPLAPSANSEIVTPASITVHVRQGDQLLECVTMQGPTLLIGRAPFCDILLADAEVPLVHSEMHCDGGVLWIEASDPASTIEVNGRAYPRLALRDGDQVHVGGHDLAVQIGHRGDLARERGTFTDDLSELSADELCDLILAEQEEIEQDDARRRDGWRKLLSALDATLQELSDRPTTGVTEDFAEESLGIWGHQNFDAAVASEFQDDLLPGSELVPELVGSSAKPVAPLESMTASIDELLLQFNEQELRASA